MYVWPNHGKVFLWRDSSRNMGKYWGERETQLLSIVFLCKCQSFFSAQRETFIGVQKGTDTDQILEVLYNYPPDDPDTASAYASIVTLCVCEAHICTQSDIYSFLKKQIFHPTNPKHQILIYAVFEEKNCFKFMYFWCKISRPQSFWGVKDGWYEVWSYIQKAGDPGDHSLPFFWGFSTKF